MTTLTLCMFSGSLVSTTMPSRAMMRSLTWLGLLLGGLALRIKTHLRLLLDNVSVKLQIGSESVGHKIVLYSVTEIVAGKEFSHFSKCNSVLHVNGCIRQRGNHADGAGKCVLAEKLFLRACASVGIALRVILKVS